MSARIPFPFYYLGIAEAVSKRSTCLSKRFGAVIVKDNSVKSTGYNGAPKGRKNCTDIGYCPRIANNVHRVDLFMRNSVLLSMPLRKK